MCFNQSTNRLALLVFLCIQDDVWAILTVDLRGYEYDLRGYEYGISNHFKNKCLTICHRVIFTVDKESKTDLMCRNILYTTL